MDVVLAVSGEEMIDDEMVDDVDAEAQRSEANLETASEPEDEIRVRSPVPGDRSRSDENVRPYVSACQVISQAGAIVPRGHAAPAEVPVQESPSSLPWPKQPNRSIHTSPPISI